MNRGIRLIPSGFRFIDKAWGGIYIGGSYLLIGPKKSGRTLVGLQFALEAAKNNDVCLLFTNMRPKDLMIQAASVNFDIQQYMSQNLIIVVRISPPNYIYDTYNADDYLIEYFNDIITVVNQYKPARIIFDEITPYIGFRNLDLLRDSFLHTLEVIEDRDITSLFVVGEPATPKAQSIVDVLANYVTGSIKLKKSEEKIDNRFFGGNVVITPNVGHSEGQFESVFKIVPKKGVVVEYAGIEEEEVEEKPTITKSEESDDSKVADLIKSKFGKAEGDKFGISNVYEYDDFLLILNNQIALYQSTGQMFNLLSFKLDPAAQVKGLLSLNQIQNAVRTATDKKDKICIVDNKIVVLVVRSDKASVDALLKKVQKNLPSADENYLNTVKEFISLLNIEVNESADNSEIMMDYIQASDNTSNQRYISLNKVMK
ncbi:MAG: hypothetical protein SCALA702_30720 [Melioribacteraceae bacterium]|nr:MAG: hypothetical protein SCALA702_30720 [Melioribacteraceae bacterium]